jgi:hypothetical protein
MKPPNERGPVPGVPQSEQDINGEDTTLNQNQKQSTRRAKRYPASDPYDIYSQHDSKWEKVDHCLAPTAQGHMAIATWRLPVPSGWLYKVTEWYGDQYSIHVCFVPKGAGDDV